MNREMIVKIAAEAAVNAAMTYMDQSRRKAVKSRHDKRLRNTRLLMKNYRLLKDHCENAVFDKKELMEVQGTNVVDLLDSLDCYEREDFIESIKNSVSRTQVIIAHIDKMIKVFRLYCDESDKAEDIRKYRVMRDLYIDRMKPADICKTEGIEQRTYYRDIKDSIEMMSSLIFGVDGLSAMSKTCQ